MPNTSLFDKFLRGPRLHEHPDPAQRVLGVSGLACDAPELIQLLQDPAPEVRRTAAERCRVPSALASALAGETEPETRTAFAIALGAAIAATTDGGAVRALLDAPETGDAVRAQVALHAADAETRRLAIENIADEEVLVDVALGAGHAALRTAAAERVQSAAPLGRLLDGARERDRGVARLARERLQSITRRATDAEAADAILQEVDALLARPGDILMAAVELERRWRTLEHGHDAERLARWEAANRRLRERFDQEREEQRARAQFERRCEAWPAGLQAPAMDALAALREEWDALRVEAERLGDAAAAERLRATEARLAELEQAAPKLAAAEALVAEAEELAAATTIDDAQLAARWQALDADARTPALTQRIDAALGVIEQRRTAIARAHQEEQGTARHELHAVLHRAEQAVAAGQLHEAREAVDRARALKPHAGLLPKPTVQRLSRVVNQLVELERWQQFGQQSARVQLCEQAEGLAHQTLAPAALAREVQKLRAEWKKLDEQQPGVPKALWERFDGACERAYAPAAKHFAELAAQHKAARRQREEFIAAAAPQGAALLEGTPDWRAVERWMRDTEATWRGSTLGSVDPAVWKKLDARLKEALAPARNALRTAREQAIREREALIAEAQALVAKAGERDVPTQVKELQSRWQAHARSIVLPQRDERALWDRFRAAFQSVFDARVGQRKEADERAAARRRDHEAIAEKKQERARQADAVQADLRRALLTKERLCEELDALASGEHAPDPAQVESVQQRWAALPPLAAEWERAMTGRHEVALLALDDAETRRDHADRIQAAAAERRDVLLELESALGIESPPDLKAQRLAVQVRELRDRFKRDAPAGSASGPQLLLKWCALPGIAEPRDRARCEAIVARLGRALRS